MDKVQNIFTNSKSNQGQEIKSQNSVRSNESTKDCWQSTKDCWWIYINYMECDKVIDVEKEKQEDFQGLKNRYLENYDQTYEQRKTKFAYSFDEIFQAKRLEQVEKQKNCWDQFKKFICCQGGNQMDQVDEQYNQNLKTPKDRNILTTITSPFLFEQGEKQKTLETKIVKIKNRKQHKNRNEKQNIQEPNLFIYDEKEDSDSKREQISIFNNDQLTRNKIIMTHREKKQQRKQTVISQQGFDDKDNKNNDQQKQKYIQDNQNQNSQNYNIKYKQNIKKKRIIIEQNEQLPQITDIIYSHEQQKNSGQLLFMPNQQNNYNIAKENPKQKYKNIQKSNEEQNENRNQSMVGIKKNRRFNGMKIDYHDEQDDQKIEVHQIDQNQSVIVSKTIPLQKQQNNNEKQKQQILSKISNKEGKSKNKKTRKIQIATKQEGQQGQIIDEINYVKPNKLLTISTEPLKIKRVQKKRTRKIKKQKEQSSNEEEDQLELVDL